MNMEQSKAETARPESKRKHNKVATQYPDFTEGSEEENRPSKKARTKYSRKPKGTLQQNGATVRSLFASDEASSIETAPPLFIRKHSRGKDWRENVRRARASTNTTATPSESQRATEKKTMASIGSRRAEQKTSPMFPLLANQNRMNIKTLLEVRIPARKPANHATRRLNVKTLLEVRIPARNTAKDAIRK
jgi:hypothetical protein